MPARQIIFTIAIASSFNTMAADLDHWRIRHNGDWIIIEGVVSGHAGNYINAVVTCDEVYAGNGTGYVEANGTWSMNIFDVPNACNTVGISRVTIDGLPVNLDSPQADDTGTIRDGAAPTFGADMPGFGPKGPAARDLEYSEIIWIQYMFGLEQDGKIGPKTMAAVKRWNRENGIDHDYISEYLIDTATEMATAH